MVTNSDDKALYANLARQWLDPALVASIALFELFAQPLDVTVAAASRLHRNWRFGSITVL
jgi:hypothetical protein